MCTKLHIYNIPNPCLNQQHYDEQRNVNIKRVRSTPFDTNNFLQSDSKARANLTRFLTKTYISVFTKEDQTHTPDKGSRLNINYIVHVYRKLQLSKVETCGRVFINCCLT